MLINLQEYLLECLPPVPVKLAEKIRWWEFVEMTELLPEFWLLPAPKEASGLGSPQRAGTSRGKRAITEWCSKWTCTHKENTRFAPDTTYSTHGLTS